jgi:hypothetical protein
MSAQRAPATRAASGSSLAVSSAVGFTLVGVPQISDFPRTRRARLTPADAGLSGYGHLALLASRVAG